MNISTTKICLAVILLFQVIILAIVLNVKFRINKLDNITQVLGSSVAVLSHNWERK